MRDAGFFGLREQRRSFRGDRRGRSARCSRRPSRRRGAAGDNVLACLRGVVGTTHEVVGLGQQIPIAGRAAF